MTFAWTGEQVTLRLPGLDRRVDWTLDAAACAARAASAADNPALDVLRRRRARSTTRQTATDYEDITRADSARGPIGAA